jgi:hypothetical protein
VASRRTALLQQDGCPAGHAQHSTATLHVTDARASCMLAGGYNKQVPLSHTLRQLKRLCASRHQSHVSTAWRRPHVRQEAVHSLSIKAPARPARQELTITGKGPKSPQRCEQPSTCRPLPFMRHGAPLSQCGLMSRSTHKPTAPFPATDDPHPTHGQGVAGNPTFNPCKQC